MLTFREGGWVLALAGFLVFAILAFSLFANRATLSRNLVGDGQHIDSYGFDLTNCLVRRELIVPAGPDLRKDGLPVPTDPPVISLDQYTADTRLGGVRKLTSRDRVIGVLIDGRARAYPLWVMCWHEIMNDTLGGLPIAVTYSPLCDSVVVFDRRQSGETIELGISGLLFNSNLLMYDRRPNAVGESLWSQLQFRAISGPAAERKETLTILPAVVASWSDWRRLHPETTIVLPDPARKRLYIRDAYHVYLAEDKLFFPVSPLPSAGDRPRKAPIVAELADGRWIVTPIEPRNEAVGDETRIRVYAAWFAWFAMHPPPQNVGQ